MEEEEGKRRNEGDQEKGIGRDGEQEEEKMEVSHAQGQGC